MNEPTVPTVQDQIFHKLGEIAGELKGVHRQSADIQATAQLTQRMVQAIQADMAALRATQQSMQERQDRTVGRVDRLEERINRQEIVAAKHGAGFGALAAAGTALIVEGIRMFINK
ncbi:MAG: hypothetical protein LBB65_02565 [Burkholderiales bacterium]|jgi:SMC interacting uncharacterized protein involved in chromosome segregation|nr:hypothetical protein [Burkholderiales bacterium]